MRKIAIVIPVLALGAAEPTPAPQPPFPPGVAVVSPAFPKCRSFHTADTRQSPTFRRLGELPPADAYQAVLRAGPDGCPDPLLVSERLGWMTPKSGR